MCPVEAWGSVPEWVAECGYWVPPLVNSAIQCISSFTCQLPFSHTWECFTIFQVVVRMPLPIPYIPQIGLLWLFFPFKVSLDVCFNLHLSILRCQGWRKPFLQCQVFISSPHNIFMQLKHQGLLYRGRDDQRAARVVLGSPWAHFLPFTGSRLSLFSRPCRHLGQRAAPLRSRALRLVGGSARYPIEIPGIWKSRPLSYIHLPMNRWL